MKILVQSARAEGTQALDNNDLQVLDEEMTRLQNLLQSFLNFARRPRSSSRREVDLRNIVSQTITVLAARAARRHISIEYRTPDRAIVLDADEAQLRQITLNLLLNALDAVADNDTIWIDIGAGSRLAADGSASLEPARGAFLCVADNGRGLPTKDYDRIFEPFFSTKETGLGLGLAICHRIVESHGGSIEVSARPGGGAVFNVFLPAAGPAENGPLPLPLGIVGAIPALQFEEAVDA